MAARLPGSQHAWTDQIELTEAQHAAALGVAEEQRIERLAYRCRRCKALKVLCGEPHKKRGRSVFYLRGRWIRQIGGCVGVQ
jgi:hypothetical protein